MVSLYERLTSQIEAKVNGAYVDESMLELFEPIPLEDITIEKWFHKNLTDLPEAAVTAAGFNPADASLFAEEFGHMVFTIAERIRMGEKDWAFAEKHGIATLGLEQLGKKVAKAASKFFACGQDGAGNAVEGNTNFLFDEGSGNGTLIRPITVTGATSGAWSTWANQNTDLVKLLGNHQAKNYNIRNSVCFYPKAASYAMMRGSADTRGISATEFLLAQGVRAVIAIPDAYFYTVANAAPAIGAFDLALVDLSQVVIGYTRMPRTRSIAPHDEVRETAVESEVWFAPYFKPQVLVEGGTAKIYKGVSTITAINGA